MAAIDIVAKVSSVRTTTTSCATDHAKIYTAAKGPLPPKFLGRVRDLSAPPQVKIQ